MSIVLHTATVGHPAAGPLLPARAARARAAVRDIVGSFALWRLCWVLAWFDIKLRYRGSVLGPFWLTLSTAVMVGAMGFIYATLFRTNLHEYLPFLALSLVLWNFIGALVAEACTGFTAVESAIRSVRLPFTLYAARIVLRNVMVLAHNLVVIVAVYALLEIAPRATALLAIPGFALWLVDGIAITLFLGAVCARFRDIPPIVGSVMQMAFFVTPVIWRPELVGPARQWLLPFNPFFSMLEIVRAPLMGNVPGVAIYFGALVTSALICGLSWLLFARVRGRIAFWV
jgi:lipopolysaccharide transport system permease protein